MYGGATQSEERLDSSFCGTWLVEVLSLRCTSQVVHFCAHSFHVYKLAGFSHKVGMVLEVICDRHVVEVSHVHAWWTWSGIVHYEKGALGEAGLLLCDSRHGVTLVYGLADLK